MAQTVGLVNVVVKDEKWYYDETGARLEGDGATADNVDPKEAVALALAGSLVADSDVLMDVEDFKIYVRPSDNTNRT